MPKSNILTSGYNSPEFLEQIGKDLAEMRERQKKFDHIAKAKEAVVRSAMRWVHAPADMSADSLKQVQRAETALRRAVTRLEGLEK